MKILSNFIFRLIAGAAILASTIFFPLYFALPVLSKENRILLGILIGILAVIEVLLFALVQFKVEVQPIRALGEANKKLLNGEYNTRVRAKVADTDVSALIEDFGGIADAFGHLEQMHKSFVANASHELRSPLTSIQGFLQAMLDGTIPSEDREKYLKIVLNEARRLSSLIDSMLDLSRMESGKSPLQPVRFEINGVIRRIIERFEPSLVKKELQLDVDFARGVSYVYADKEKIVQVLVNLIDNAIKYSPAYSRILVTTHVHGKKLYVTVKDQGFGIGKKDQMLIWDRFYMADKARTPVKGKGTGLGLSIVKKIIDEHKEAVWVESNKGAGATFIFTLTLFDPGKHRTDGGVVLQKGATKPQKDEEN